MKVKEKSEDLQSTEEDKKRQDKCNIFFELNLFAIKYIIGTIGDTRMRFEDYTVVMSVSVMFLTLMIVLWLHRRMPFFVENTH